MTAYFEPGTRWRNWGRSVSAHPAHVARPASTAEVSAVVRTAGERRLTVKPVGAGHSFSPIAATSGVQLDLAALSGLVAVDAATGRVRLRAGTRLWEVPALLAPHGLALENLGDIDRQTVAGATSTGTHGTGLGFRGLAAQLTGATLVTADGSVLEVDGARNAELLPAVRLGLGALGVLVEVEVQCVPAFLLRAEEHPEPLDRVMGGWKAFAASADHAELYWWPHTDTVMTKRNTRLSADTPHRPPGRIAAAIEERLLENEALRAVVALGSAIPALTPPLSRLATRVYGDRTYTAPSHEVFTSPRTVRFRECEYGVPLAAVPAAMRELRALIDRRGWRISFPVEVRAAAQDDSWLSTAYGRDTGYIAVHRYWRDDPREFLRETDALLRSFDGRPHWGKWHHLDADGMRARYPRFDDFLAVRDRLDPDRRFANGYLREVLGP